MHDSKKNQDSDENLDELDDDLGFDDEFGFDEEWDDEEDIPLDEQSPVDVAAKDDAAVDLPEEVIDIESPEDPGTEPGEKAASAPEAKLEPERLIKAKKKKNPFVFLSIVLVIILAIGLTAYNTLRQSLAPALVPIIKLTGSPETQNEDSFVEEKQKRINEILENAREKEAETKEELMTPFEEESNIPGDGAVEVVAPTQPKAEEASVLTPLPADIEEMETALPPLESLAAPAEQASPIEEDVDVLELSGDLETENDDVLSSPFSEEVSLDENSQENGLMELVAGNASKTEEVAIIEPVEIDEIPSLDDSFLSNEDDDVEDMAFVDDVFEEEAETLGVPEENNQKIEEETEELESRAQKEKEEALKAAQAVKTEQAKADAIEIQKTPKAPPSAEWVIRGIRPGRAVLYDKVTGDIEAVEAGSKIRGLGRVTEVAKKDGRWGVFGTEGNVTQ